MVAIGMALTIVQADPLFSNSNLFDLGLDLDVDLPILNQRARAPKPPKKSPFPSNKQTCKAPQCIQIAKEIINDMNPQADPCQDFSQFACGGFYEHMPEPTGKMSVDNFAFLMEKNNQAIREIVDPTLGKSPTPSKNDKPALSNLKKLHDFFASCMDQQAISKAGRQPLVHQIKSILTPFPVPSGSSTARTPADKKAVARTLAELSKQRLAGLVQLEVGPDPKEPLRHVLGVSESGASLSREDLKNPEALKELEEHIAHMFQAVFGKEESNKTKKENKNEENDEKKKRLTPKQPDDTKPDIHVDQQWRDVAKEIIEFEKQLAAMSSAMEDRSNPLKNDNRRTITQLSELVPGIDWALFISETLPRGVVNSRPIIVESPGYLAQLGPLLQKTKAQTLRNYFIWKVISDSPATEALMIDHTRMHTRLARRNNNHRTTTKTIPRTVTNNIIRTASLPDTDIPRWQTCVQQVNENLGDLAGHYYIQTAFPGNSRPTVLSIVDSILQTYKRAFPTLQWLDKTTLQGALQKLKDMVRLMGYSTKNPDVASSKSLQTHYKDLPISRTDYFANLNQYAIWSTRLEMSKLNQPVDRKHFLTYPQLVNAFYNPSANQILFPAGILQRPFFHVDNPEYVNYGGFGVVAGHEIGHGFDNTGRFYDSIGRVHNWWSNNTIQAFNQRSQCLIDQYGNYTIKGPDNKEHHLDGKLTLGENIADNGGLKYSFRAWQYRLQSDVNGKK
ncbi:hypothetical protein BGZ95_003000 [Linnemannia exigua]|uniref:Uncharacterized protein n=1 Tax=Linnemannia exigua TaxID=604196 RepID=A0AAD4H2K8_9FUNG|nr:hypothetical protein BGZ95_003000 [Linnemannia exigua]